MRIDQIELSGSLSISSSLATNPLTVNDNYLFVSNTGNVGIGTKTPTSKLVVTGSVSVQGSMVAKSLVGSLTGSVKLPTIAQGTSETNIVLVNESGGLVFRSNLSLTGAQGTQGIQGTNGTIGVNGAQGIQGDTGAQGTQGIQGDTGAQGIQGTVGAQGTNGTIGVNGAQGNQGPIGAQGTSGTVQMAIIRETTSTNVASGVLYANFTNTAQSKPRQVNSKIEAGLGIALSGSPNWTFTISTAGTYLFEATAMLSVPPSDGQTVFGKLLLNNITLSLASVIVGDSFIYGPVNSGALTNSNFPHTMNGIYTITGTTIFRLDHVIISQYFPPTGGKPSNVSGYEEVYATLKITKIN